MHSFWSIWYVYVSSNNNINIICIREILYNDTRYKLVPILLKKLKKKKVYLYNTNVLLNFISVNDLNKFIYKKILLKRFKNEKVIIEAKDQYSLKQLIYSLRFKNKFFIYKNISARNYIIDKSIDKIPSIKFESKLSSWLKKKINKAHIKSGLKNY